MIKNVPDLRYGIGANEPAFIYCRNGKKTAELFGKNLEKICRQREKEVCGTHDSFNEVSDYEARQLQFADYLRRNEGVKFINTDITDFSDGEMRIKIQETVNGREAYLFQNTFNPQNPIDTSYNITELELMIRALKESDSSSITVILPYLSYSRGDRRTGREATGARLMLDKLATAGANKLLVMDLHADQVESFGDPNIFQIKNLYASNLFIDYFIKTLGIPNISWNAPDPGAGKRIRHFAKVSGSDMTIGYKVRRADAVGETEGHRLLGDVEGQAVAIIDDESASGGTLIEMAKLCKGEGASKVFTGVTHGKLVGDAFDKFVEAKKEGIIEQLVITNSVMHDEDVLEANKDFLHILDATEMFAQAVFELHVHGSISKLYTPTLRDSMFGKGYKVLDH